MLNLKLERPLVFFDLETTGVNFQTDRIVEIAVIKVMPDGTRQVKTRAGQSGNADSAGSLGGSRDLRQGR